jgi:indole-3-glycerol phosphate synthase
MVGDRLPDLLRHVHHQGMLALVETRGPAELRYLDGLEPLPRLIGINNKNIDELEMGEDLVRVSPEMLTCYRRVVGETVIISESAHRSVADVRRALAAGADAVLVGTAFLLAAHPAAAVASFVRAGEEWS